MKANETYPVFAAANWWKLRNKFKSSYPRGPVSEEYLAAVLDMQISSVKNNGILANLRALGLLDAENKCTDLANKWRLDDSYVSACQQIRDRVYPSELIDLGTERNAVVSWFMNKSGAGESLAGKLTSLYLLVSLPSLDNNSQKTSASQKKPVAAPKNTDRSQIKVTKKNDAPKTDNASNNESQGTANLPSMNINLQIHISSDASPEQIEQIFASMAKHLYGRE